MHWLGLLFSAKGYQVPQACGSWTPFVTAMNVNANILLFLVYMTMTALLIMFRLRRTSPAFFRESRLALWFAAFISASGITHLCRVVSFVWPAYRLFTLVSWVSAALSWITLAVMFPVAIEQERQRGREERHAFADRMNVESLQAQSQLRTMRQVVNQMEERDREMMATIRELKAMVHDLQGHESEQEAGA